MSPKQFFKSIKYSIRGIDRLWKTEQNFRIQVIIGIIAIFAAWYFPLDVWERIVVVFLVAGVLILEAINSVFERLVDVLKSRVHPSVRDMKDIMAAAVLIMSLVALIVGVTIFYPAIVG